MQADFFKNPKPILGKVRLLPLPGAPGWEGQWEPLITRAEQEATALASGGVDGLIIENAPPYPVERMDVAGAIALAMLVRKLRQLTSLPVGICIRENDPETALAIAINTQAEFIRLPLLSGAMLTDNGVVNGRFSELLHYKNRLKAVLPLLLVDISTRQLTPEPGPSERLEHLTRLIRALPTMDSPMGMVLRDGDITPDELAGFRSGLSMPILVENTRDSARAEGYFRNADGLILEAGITKKNGTVDMVKVEELLGPLRNIIPVTEMDPDIFLRR